MDGVKLPDQIQFTIDLIAQAAGFTRAEWSGSEISFFNEKDEPFGEREFESHSFTDIAFELATKLVQKALARK